MSGHDTPTTSYREIATEWWGTLKEITNGWEFWFAMIVLQTVTVIQAYTDPAIETVPVYADVAIYIICIIFFIDGWSSR